MRAVAVFMVLTLALAGCGDKKSAAPVEEDDLLEGNTIRGVVVTPTIQPITGATVTLAPSGTADTTDLFGRFSFKGLEPGTYTVKAEAEGHASTVTQVQVIDGEVARPRIQLNPIRPPSPGHETLTFSGFIPGWFGPADETLEPYKENLGFPPCDCDFFFSIPAGTVAVTLEMVWEDAFKAGDPVPAPAYRYSVTPFTGSHEASGAEPSPMHVDLRADSFTGDGAFSFDGVKAMRLSIAPDETWPTVEQAYEIYLTIWEVDLPPDGWSFVSGDR